MKAWVYDRSDMGPAPPGVELTDDPQDADFAVPRWRSMPDLHAMPALRVVQVLSAGIDWIGHLVPEHVILCDARGARDRAMAEWVVAALLADVKGARRCGVQQGRGEWEYFELRDLSGARVLILGFGSIGQEVAKLLAPFDCEVTGVVRRPRVGVHTMDQLPTLLPTADVVVNLLPITDATRGAVGARELALLRDGALYVNAGRGKTTDTDALLAELRSGRLRAVLDVVDPEPLPPDHPLWTAPNVIITPHNAGDTPASERAAWALAVEQMRRYAAGEQLRNVVTDGY